MFQARHFDGKGPDREARVSLDAIKRVRATGFPAEEESIRARSRITTEEVNVYNARICDREMAHAGSLDVRDPFGIEVDLRLNRLLERPMFSIGINNDAECYASGTIPSRTAWQSRVHAIASRAACIRKTIWQTAITKCIFAVRDGASFETLERIAGPELPGGRRLRNKGISSRSL